MRKLEGRAVICIMLALLLIAGLGLFIGKLVIHGDEWASFYGNTHVYKDGKIVDPVELTKLILNR